MPSPTCWRQRFAWFGLGDFLSGRRLNANSSSRRWQLIGNIQIFDTITNGFGVMPSYAPQVSVNDRWAIIAYIKALQLSRSQTVADIPPAELAKLESGGGK